MATIYLRSNRSNPLTIAEVDENFTNLNNDKLESSAFTGTQILNRLKDVDGAGSSLDADLLDGMQSAVGSAGISSPNTIVARDISGNIFANSVTAALNGNAATVTNGVYTSGSYADPTWLTSLAGSKVTSIPNTSLVNNTINLNGTSVSLGGSYDVTANNLNWLVGTQTFGHTKFILADGTKRAIFSCSSITTNATRTLTIPDTAGTPTIATQEYVQTVGQNSQGVKTVQAVSAGTPLSAFGSNGDIVYQY